MGSFKVPYCKAVCFCIHIIMYKVEGAGFIKVDISRDSIIKHQFSK